MPTLYMSFWSVVLILALGVSRLRHWSQILMLALVTAVILIFSQSLFIQFSIAAGLEPGTVLSAAGAFVAAGPMGWLALLIMPVGWLGPIIGLNLVQRHASRLEEVV